MENDNIRSEYIKELEIKVEELKRQNKIMVGRELKMVELKKEIIDLKKLSKKYNRNNKKGRK